MTKASSKSKSGSRRAGGRADVAVQDGASTKASAPRAPLFVDAVEGGVARLLDGAQVFTLPARLLPPGAREGTWVDVELSGPVTAPAGADEAERVRGQLADDDPGGDITL